MVAHCNIITAEGNIQRNRFNLYVNEISELVKTGEVIVKYICDVLQDYGFSEEEVKGCVTFVTDRGSNFKYGLISNGFKRNSCYAHLLHNLVKATFLSQEAKIILKNAASVTNFVRKSNVNSQLDYSLKTFSRTRWNGAHAMLDAIAKNYNKLYTLLYDRQSANSKLTCFDSISALKQDELEYICNFLLPFKELTDRLEGEKNETLSLVWPIYTELWTYLQPDSTETQRPMIIIEQMKNEALKYFMKRDSDFKPTMKHKIATVLNPQFKHVPASQVRQDDLKEIYDKIESMCTNPDTMSVPIQPAEENVTSEQMLEKVHPFLRAFCKFGVPTTNLPTSTELRKYLDEDVLSPDNNVTDYWNSSRIKYPQLFKLFANISYIPATSSSGERVFSRTGLIVNSLRSKILPKNVNNIMIVNNLRNIPKKDDC